MQVVKQLLDKIIFTFGFIIFLQLPHFIDQYTQRIGGFAESRFQQLADYQSIANQNFNGSLDLLIENFTTSTDQAIRQTGEKVAEAQTDSDALKKEIAVLENEGFIKKFGFLMTHLRLDIAKGTLGVFQPGIPLSAWSLLYGLIGGIIFSLMFNGLSKTPKLLKRKNKSIRQS